MSDVWLFFCCLGECRRSSLSVRAAATAAAVVMETYVQVATRAEVMKPILWVAFVGADFLTAVFFCGAVCRFTLSGGLMMRRWLAQKRCGHMSGMGGKSGDADDDEYLVRCYHGGCAC